MGSGFFVESRKPKGESGEIAADDSNAENEEIEDVEMESADLTTAEQPCVIEEPNVEISSDNTKKESLVEKDGGMSEEEDGESGNDENEENEEDDDNDEDD